MSLITLDLAKKIIDGAEEEEEVEAKRLSVQMVITIVDRITLK